MNTNKLAKTILCFGDSNTRGTKPDGSGRYNPNERWTGQLQDKLGDDFYVIEEGLGGRTTAYEDGRPGKKYRSGIDYFIPCLQSHSPVELVIIMLSTNDFKNINNVSHTESANQIENYCKYVKNFDPKTKMILVAPAVINPVEPITYYDEQSAEKSRDFISELQKVAKENETGFYDANKSVTVGKDGLHWTLDSSDRFSTDLCELVKGMLYEN